MREEGITKNHAFSNLTQLKSGQSPNVGSRNNWNKGEVSSTFLVLLFKNAEFSISLNYAQSFARGGKTTTKDSLFCRDLIQLALRAVSGLCSTHEKVLVVGDDTKTMKMLCSVSILQKQNRRNKRSNKYQLDPPIASDSL